MISKVKDLYKLFVSNLVAIVCQIHKKLYYPPIPETSLEEKGYLQEGREICEGIQGQRAQ